MKKKLLFALSTTSIVAAAAIALAPKVSSASFAEGCEHEGNHYGAVAATCESAGNVEFWACCVCHEQFLSQPDKGTWSDLGAYAGPALSPSHVAYVAPAHGESSYNLRKDGNTLTIVSACSECGEGEPTSVAATLPPASTATWTMNDVSSRTDYQWTFDEATGVYTSGNYKVDSTVSLMELTVTGAGTIAMDITINCEANYDYLTIYKNSSITEWKSYSKTTNTANGAVYSTYGKGSSLYEESAAIDVEVGDVITFARRKDGSSSTGLDRATVKFNQAATYGMVGYNTNGGESVLPGITINGCIATDLPTPTKEGYIFDGWFANSDLSGDELAKGSYVGNDTTVYAKWWDVNEQHPLMGTYKGFGFKAHSASKNLSILSNATLTINFKGEITTNASYWSDHIGATKINTFEDGAGTMGKASYEYYEDDGIIIVHRDNLKDNYGYIFVKDSTQAYTQNGTVINCGFGGADYGTYALYSYPVADGTTKYFYANGQTGQVYNDVSYTTLRDVEVTPYYLTESSGSNATGGFQVFDKEGNVIETFGYNKKYSFAPSSAADADEYYGAYTNSVSNDETVSKIYVSGHGKFYVDNDTSSKEYTIEDNVLSYASGHDAVSYTLDKETMTFVRNVPTVTITYNLNGHEAALSDGSGAFKLNSNTQLACAGGAWLYESDLAKVVNSKSTDGNYVFEGWYKNAECTEAFEQIHPTVDIVLYAKWARLYKVTLVLNNGEDNQIVDVKEGNTPSLSNPSRDGWMFGGWYTDSECTESYVPGACTGDQTLYAKWVEQPDFAKGTYKGYECWSAVYNSAKSESSSHSFSFDQNGNVYKGTTKYGTYDGTSSVASGVLTVAEGKVIGFSNKYHGRYIATSAWSGLGNDPVPGDMTFAVQLFAGESVRFVQTTLVSGSAFLVQVIITGSENAETFTAYVDADNDKVYAGVDLAVTRGETTTDAFADVYASTYADSIIISLDGTTVGVWGKNGSSLKRGDAYAGTYTGSLNGVAKTLVLNGFGSVTSGDETGTYTVSGEVITVVLGGVTYKITVSGATYSQVLDGYEGSYSGANGELVVTGWGDCTLNGVAGTYSVASANLLRVDVAGAVSFLTVDKTAGTYTAASASPFAGLTFTYIDSEWDDDYGWTNSYHKIIFDDSAAISGKVEFGYSSYSATFTGAYDVSTQNLVITLTSNVPGYTTVGKTGEFTVEDGGLVCTGGSLSGFYHFFTGEKYANSSFVAPVVEETPAVTSYSLSDFAGDYVTGTDGLNISVSSSSIVVTGAGENIMESLCGNCGYSDSDYDKYQLESTADNEWTVKFECSHGCYTMVIQYDGEHVTLVSLKYGSSFDNGTVVLSNVVLQAE